MAAETATAPPRSDVTTTAGNSRPDDRGLTRVAWGGIALVLVLQAAVVGWYTAHSWFYVDDFLFLRQAKDYELGGAFLRLPLFEHFSPFHRVADWLFMQAGTPSWPLAAAVLVILTFGCSLAFVYLLTAVTTRTGLVVGATAVYSLSLFFIRTSLFWTAGVHLLGLTLFSMLAFGGYVRWHRRRALRSLVLSIVGLALALLTLSLIHI